jgi:glycosyltransferase involved in cell wall biosynthesis
MKIPLVSVCCAAYNHEQFIKECLDGFLMQKTNFVFEILINDDASTDNTASIIKEYEKKYPDIIKPIYQKENQYSKEGNVYPRFNFPRAKGKYIAICDGDDYWTDPLKLQQQVDFLEVNSQYALTCGGYISKNLLTGENKTILQNKSNLKISEGYTFTLDDMITQWITKSLTVVFRKSVLNLSILQQYKRDRDIHLFYHIMVAKKGYYFNNIFGVYNMHSGGVHSNHHGKINTNAAYNAYKELYFYNKDKFTRVMALRATLSLFNFKIYNKYIENSFSKLLRLCIDAVLLIRNFKEVKWFFNSFFSIELKNRFKTAN